MNIIQFDHLIDVAWNKAEVEVFENGNPFIQTLCILISIQIKSELQNGLTLS